MNISDEKLSFLCPVVSLADFLMLLPVNFYGNALADEFADEFTGKFAKEFTDKFPGEFAGEFLSKSTVSNQ